ncbi:MAG: GNAT family protein [Isosphaeraceae bacterium]|nr:GNAT family protein [Isosphaeraceae bacterium]
MEVNPVVLSGRLVRLEPLSLDHVPDLAEAGRDEAVWPLMPYGTITTVAQMAGFVREALAQPSDRPFAVIHRPDGRAIGSTRYLDIRPRHRGLEIGGTWYAPSHQRTGVNTECKYLLLRHAFEALGCIRVQLKTDQRNERSQRAIERLGAVREGVLRSHVIMPDGYRRASVMYSIIDEEWPGVRARLERFLARDA